MNEESTVNAEQMVQLLTDMGFVNDAPQIKNQYVTEIWNHLHGNENETVNVFNIKVFLSAIMNFSHSWMLAPNTSANETQQ